MICILLDSLKQPHVFSIEKVLPVGWSKRAKRGKNSIAYKLSKAFLLEATDSFGESQMI